ncbi:glycerate kinase [Acidithiobacillus sp. M4-SHS-6]|uniref:glycerate kinase n=1 Tax=Acidithiobacillus sp. M4-SHS-6 TaxID=3383024 RepID=UPI0039BE23E1
MRILIVPDHFKGSLTAVQAAAEIHAGLAEIYPDWKYRCLALADGGEGTLEVLLESRNGERIERLVHDPLHRRIKASFGLFDGGEMAVIEMAEASGLLLLASGERNPEICSTLGTGELIRAALDSGCRKLVIGVGGSATNDGGMGMLSALGARFYDRHGTLLSPSGQVLQQIQHIDLEELDQRLAHCTVEVIGDVDNPLLGPTGATRVFGPQKGADPAMVDRLERGMQNYARCLERVSAQSISRIPGSGAAGGIVAACLAVFHARLRPGIDVIAKLLDLEKEIQYADLVISGEGCVDSQTTHGKVVAGVARRTRRWGKPLLVLAGSRSDDMDALREMGIDVILTTLPRLTAEKAIFAGGAKTLRETARNAALLLRLGKNLGSG